MARAQSSRGVSLEARVTAAGNEWAESIKAQLQCSPSHFLNLRADRSVPVSHPLWRLRPVSFLQLCAPFAYGFALTRRG